MDVSFDDVQVVFVARPTEPKKVEDEVVSDKERVEGEEHESHNGEVIENVLLEKTADGVRIRINRIQTEEDKLLAAQNKMREHVFRELVNTKKSYYEFNDS